MPAAAEVLDLQHDLVARGFLALEAPLQLAPDHQADDLLLGRLGDGKVAGGHPVLQHDHAIGDFHHLVQAVRDIDDPQPVVLQLPDQLEQALGFFMSQGRGRLVEGDDLGPFLQRAHDLDDMHLRGGQGPAGHVEVDQPPEPVTFQHFGGRLAGGAEIDAATGQAGQFADEDVLGDGYVGDDLGLLPDQPEPGFARFQRAGMGGFDAIQHNLAFVQLIVAAEDLQQGGLARPVFPDECHDLAAVHVH